jgi:outer membrane protein OmpA-like peptidoglycan-associated protein
MVFFDTNSSALSAITTDTLNNFLKYCPSVEDGVAVFTTFVSGHTDTTGAPQANLALSRARVESVRNYLVSHGLPAESIDVRAYGDTKPLVSGTGESTDKQNRRVQLTRRKT